MKIFKYRIPPINDVLIEMPRGAVILSVQAQRGEVMLWVEVDTAAPPIKRRFKIRGTGHDLPEDARHYVGTVVLMDGDLVLHVYTDKIEYPMDHDFSSKRPSE